jgi:ABC-type nitrate/sulfonate/bicarbonate transport system substrate-binding protein
MIVHDVSRRSLLRGCAGTLAAAAAQSVFISFDARSAESINLTLPWIPEGEVAFMYAARQQGFWARRGLDVSITRGFGSGEAAKNVGIGRYDFGQADLGAMINVASSGLPLVSIAMVSQRSPVCIIARKGSGITRPKDLEGKRLGGAPAGATNQLWPAFARINGIDVSKVQLVSLQPGVDMQALINGNVDAVATLYQSSAPYLWAENVPFETIFFARNGLDIYSLTFITQPANLQRSSKQVAAFAEGAMEGLRFSYLEPDKTLDDFIAAIPESGKTARDREITRHSLLINTATGMTEDVRKNGLGWHDPAKVEYTLNTVNTFLKLRTMPAVTSIYTNDFVGNVRLTEEEWKRARELARDYLFG